MFGWAFLHNKILHSTMPVLPTTYHKRITLPAVAFISHYVCVYTVLMKQYILRFCERWNVCIYNATKSMSSWTP